jgi:hypothetical protein
METPDKVLALGRQKAPRFLALLFAAGESLNSASNRVMEV